MNRDGIAMPIAIALLLAFGVFPQVSAAGEVSIEKGAQIYKEIPRETVFALAQYIQAYGYSCRSISAVTPFAFSRGYSVVCNEWTYSYEVEDKGGNWVVTVD
ncbi:MAG: hypothetical protein AB7U81_11445 [Thiohalomonadaceae bacterium]